MEEIRDRFTSDGGDIVLPQFSGVEILRFADGSAYATETKDGIEQAHTPDGTIPLRTLLDKLGLPLDRYATPQEYIDWLSEKGLLGAIAASLQWVGRLVGKTFGLSVAGKVPKQ